MAKILSVKSPHLPPEIEKEAEKENFFKKLWESFLSLDKFTKAFIIIVILFLITAPYIKTHYLDTRQRAAENTPNVPPSTAKPEPEFISNELLIKVKKEVRDKVKEGNPLDTGIESLNSINKQFRAKGFERIAKVGKNSKPDAEVFGWYLVVLDIPAEKIQGKLDQASQRIEASQQLKNHSTKSIFRALNKLDQLISKFNQDPNIEAVDLNYIVHTTLVPNDPYYSSTGSWGQAFDDLYGMKKINAASAWDQSTGLASIIVAGIDTGVDRNHPDIAANMWVNTGEIPGNGIDDDGNGYIDDYYGCNFINMNGNVCGDPMDDHGHGTHTVGTIAAVGNNGVGVVGVNWTSKIMALKFLDSNGSGNTSDGAKALQYAADMGARVSSNSWGGGGQDQVTDDAIKYEHDKGMVIAVAAGNSNNDALDQNPASADYAITVAASDYTDAKASFSSWGEKIDVAAPGVDILSLKAANNNMCTSTRGNIVGSNYCRVSGTSMATPHVAGLAALLLSKNPTLTNEEVRQIIRNGADDLGTSGKDTSFGYGRINALGSMNLVSGHILAPVITSPLSRTIIPASTVQITGGVPGPNFTSFKLEYGQGRTPSSWTTISSSTTQIDNGVLGNLDGTKLNDGTYTIRLSATDTSGKSYQFQVFDLLVDDYNMAITNPRAVNAPVLINVSGTALTKNGLTFSNYKLEWSKDSTNWSTTGVTLTNNGTQPVSNGQLGTWDTTGFSGNNTYSLRLTASSSTGGSAYITIQTLIDNEIATGWPKAIHRASNCYYWFCQAAPTVADLDGDGVKEIIVTSPDNKIYVFRKDGSNFPGFPVSVSDAGDGEIFAWPASVDDLDGDGKKEIIAVALTPSYMPCGACGRLYVFKSDGSMYPGWIPQEFIADNYMPVSADLDGDGKKEIVLIDAYYQKIYAYHANGTELAGFPKPLPTAKISAAGTSPAIFDIDHDGKPEIAYGSGDTLYLFNNDGSLRWKYAAPVNSDGRSANFGAPPAGGDVDGDGNLELFAIDYGGSGMARVFGLNKDGVPLPNWPMTASNLLNAGIPQLTPSLVDIDGDGKDEIIVGLWNPMIFTLTGMKSSDTSISSQTNPSVADADGDGKIEFSALANNSVGLINDDATTYWSRLLPYEGDTLIKGNTAGREFSSPALLSDLDNDGTMELIVGEDKGFYLNDPLLYIWEVPRVGSNPAKYEWPMFAHDPQRTGRLVLGGILPSPSPIPTQTPTNTPTPITVTNPVQPTPTPTPVSGDTTPPIVSIISPLNGAVLTKNSSFTISANASDNIGVVRVEFYVDTSLKCSDTTYPYSCTTKIAGKSGVTHRIIAKAYDNANNSSTSSITVTIK